MSETRGALDALLHCLELRAEGPDRFSADCEPIRHGRIFGGQVLAQALMAAGLTVDDRPCHSLQAYFLAAGDPSLRVEFETERLRDGRSFSARRVDAKQGDRVLLTLQAAFHASEDGYEHQDPMPEAPRPSDLPNWSELVAQTRARFPESSANWAGIARPLEVRHSVVPSYMGGEPVRDTNYCWMRVEEPLPESPLLHQCILAYASDLALNDSAFRPHSGAGSKPLQAMSSLDHAMWFHEAARVDEWFLYTQRSPKAKSARGFARGEMYTEQGHLVATVGQDSLMRPQL